MGFLIAVLNYASDKGTLNEALSALISDLLIEQLIIPTSGETPAQVRELGIINIAIKDVPPCVGLGSAQLTNAMHYRGVGEITMKFIPPGVVSPMLAKSWELDFNPGDSIPYGATLRIRDDVIFHGQGLGYHSNNGGSWVR